MLGDDIVRPSTQGLDMLSDSASDVTNAKMYRGDKGYFSIFCQNRGLTGELCLTFFLLLTFQLTLVDKFWDPLVLNKVLGNWNENPIIEMKLLDFTGKEYDDYWKGKFDKKDILGKPIKWNLNCPKGFEEIAQGYWFGMKDGCVCYGDFGGRFNTKFDKISTKPCTDEQIS